MPPGKDADDHQIDEVVLAKQHPLEHAPQSADRLGGVAGLGVVEREQSGRIHRISRDEPG
jgi:hypothetical protein